MVSLYSTNLQLVHDQIHEYNGKEEEIFRTLWELDETLKFTDELINPKVLHSHLLNAIATKKCRFLVLIHRLVRCYLEHLEEQCREIKALSTLKRFRCFDNSSQQHLANFLCFQTFGGNILGLL